MGNLVLKLRGTEGAAEASQLGYALVLWLSPLLPFHWRCGDRSARVTVLGQAGEREMDFSLVGRACGKGKEVKPNPPHREVT